MWQDFFYYSKSERRAILVLLVVAVLGLAAYWAGYRIGGDTSGSQDLVTHAEADTLQQRLKQRNKYPRSQRRFAPREKRPPREVVLQAFNPNTADSLTLYRLGLSDFVIRNILRYREKGGSFRTPEAFSKIYGLPPEQFAALRPYIQLPAPVAAVRVDTAAPKQEVKRPAFVPKYAEGTVVNLNAADTSALKRVPGIGSVLARKIVAYRNRLGGFCRVEQLQEISHVDTTVNKWFCLGSGELRRIEVNHASLDELRRHPYMDFYKARAIVEYRRKRGKIKGLSRLTLFEEFSEKDLERLSPYLSFE